MKTNNKIYFFLLILILSISFTAAIESTLKQEYSPGETLIAEFSGNFIKPISTENIKFYSGRAFIPMVYDVAKINDKLYVYALLPNIERNYTLILEQISFYEQGEEYTKDFNYNFSVAGNSSLFSANPGFIVTDKDFSIKLESKIKTISLSYSFFDQSGSFSLAPGKSKLIDFSILNVLNSSTSYLNLKADSIEYNLPIIIFKNSESTSLIQNPLRFSRAFVNLSLSENQLFKVEIPIVNSGQDDLRDIIINSSDSLTILSVSPKEIPLITAGQLVKINATVLSSNSGIFSGYINLYSSNYSDNLPVFIEIVNNTVNQEIPQTYIDDYSCSDLNGNFCLSDETCSGSIRTTWDGSCCIGTCEKTSSWTSTIIIIILIIALGLIGYFLYKRFKEKPKDYSDVLKKKSNSYEERFSPKQIRGSLSKN